MGNPEYARQITDGGDPYKGRQRIMNYGCAGCHTIPGIPDADATVGPQLDRLAHRTYIAGVLKNTPDNMIAWIQNAPGVDEKTAMPNLHVTREDAKDIASYLYTLK
jgi:mono/diheme cytochrome c family protein